MPDHTPLMMMLLRTHLAAGVGSLGCMPVGQPHSRPGASPSGRQLRELLEPELETMKD